MNDEIKEQIRNAHWNVFENHVSEYELAKMNEDGYFLADEFEDAEETVEIMEGLGLDIISLAKHIWGENSTDFVVGLLVTVVSKNQLMALTNHLLEIVDKENK
jgi:hypothetical protein